MRRRAGYLIAGLVGTALLLTAAGFGISIPSPKEPPYRLIKVWGTKGHGAGQFQDPTGIAVADGEVYVADARNGRIQVFDTEGNFRRQIGRPGARPGELGRPMNISIASDRLYVAEHWTDRIQIFTLEGEALGVVGGSGTGPGTFREPGGVAVSHSGIIYAADFHNHRIQKLDADGGFVRLWGENAEPGILPGRFRYPTDVALGPDGTLYVADGFNDRVQAFSADGGFLRMWGGLFGLNTAGSLNGWFSTVTSIAVGPQGNVFVADFYNSRIQKFTPEGRFLTAFGRGLFRFALGVAVAEDGTVYTTDFGNHRVIKWSAPAASPQSEPRPGK
jgi:DNA-binding beta-propeller fold protein YncE